MYANKMGALMVGKYKKKVLLRNKENTDAIYACQVKWD